MTNANEKTDYSKGKIYVIISPNHDLFYYGSTVETMKKRFDNHKSSLKCTSKKIIDAGNAQIYEIEKFPCSSLHELEDREAFYILNDWDGCVNKEVPGSIRRAGGKKAYDKIRNDKPEQKAKMKAYNKTNNAKPEVKAKKKVYNSKPEVKAHRAEKIICKVCGCMNRRSDMSRHQKRKKCQKFLKNELDELMNEMITQIEIEN